MASSQGKHMPKDTQIIVSIMKDLGIVEYDQQVLNHLLEFNYRYTTLLLDDAKTFSNFAKKKNVDADDVKIAIQLAQDGIFCRPPPRDVLMTASREVNKIPLPPVRPASGLRIPHDRSNFLQTNYRLRDDLYSGGNLRKDTKTTAAEMLEASRKLEMEDNPFQQSNQMMNNSMEFDLQEIIENRHSSQESIGENDKDELMDAQAYQNPSYSDIALDDTVEKQLSDMLRYGSVPSIDLPSTAFLKSTAHHERLCQHLKKLPTKCSPMRIFKKFESFGHSPKRQAINIFTADNEVHNAITLNDELSGIKKFNRSLFGSNSLNNIDETPNGSCSVTGDQLKCIVEYTITKLNECGFIPKVVICDQGSNNLKMRKLFNVTKENPFITYNNENLFFMHDSPHLLKSVRNNLKKYIFENGNELYSWRDIEDFYNIDCNNTPRLASKLFGFTPFSPMQVCLATQTSSNSVSSGILTLVSFNKLSARVAITAKFVKIFNDLFDVFNSIKLNEPIVLKRPLTKNSLHWNLIQRSFKIFIRVEDKQQKRNPSNNANCEKDDSEFLALTKDIKTSIISLHKSYNESDEIDNIDDYYSSMNIEYILIKDETANSVAYVTGWICSQLDHKPCIEILATKNKDADTKFDLDNTHIGMKEYEGCSLLYPHAKTLEKHVSALFQANIENLLLKKKCNLKKDLKLIIGHVCKKYSLSICKDCNTQFLDTFLNVSINCYVKKCNDLFNQYKCSKNKKLKKVVHV
ncbi:hypothetical protein QTP88_023639 [Uroleucon formosanum]